MKSISVAFYLACLALAYNTISAQDFQGVATYQSKTTIDFDGFGGRQLTEEQKKRIEERMKSMFEKTYTLTFNKFESMYKEVEKLETPGGGGGFRIGFMSSFTGGPQYKNVKENQLLQEQEFFGKQFLVKDSLPKLEWKMGTETKQIGQYICFKATAIKKVDDLDFRSIRRRNRPADDEKKDGETVKDSTKTNNSIDGIEVPKEIEVTAWYTPQIPVNQGPDEYWGLPGLILEVDADRTTILCSKIVINPQDKEEIKVPSKGKEVTKQEYNTIVKQKIEEMRENFRGRNRGGFRRN
ncbi:MAG TPA: GLPGLI family protein [Flavobacteriaceae bacterium]|nr:GLPGLI family protein [Flavobacteriaceae bacterium]